MYVYEILIWIIVHIYVYFYVHIFDTDNVYRSSILHI